MDLKRVQQWTETFGSLGPNVAELNEFTQKQDEQKHKGGRLKATVRSSEKSLKIYTSKPYSYDVSCNEFQMSKKK